MASQSSDRTKIAAYIFIGIGTLLMVNEVSRWIGINLLALVILLPGAFMLRNVAKAYGQRKTLNNNDLLQGGLGLLLLIIGLSNLLSIQLNIFGNIWPLAMIAVGAFLLMGPRRNG